MNKALTVQDIRTWQRERLKTLTGTPPAAVGPSSVTIAAYHFWADDIFDAEFDYIEMAIRETWKQLGFLKTVMIVNRVTPRIERFQSQFPSWIKIDVCADLKPGDIYSMCRDCIGKLHQRFDTDYVLYVHPDGWALRPGLEEFIGQYDFIGAPWVFNRDDWIGKMLLPHRGDVGNGGFSLRTRKMLEIGAWYYHRRYKLIPNCFLLYEDIYFTRFLSSYERLYRDVIRVAPAQVAAEFSLELNIEIYERIKKLPLGFHKYSAFSRLVEDGYVVL